MGKLSLGDNVHSDRIPGSFSQRQSTEWRIATAREVGAALGSEHSETERNANLRIVRHLSNDSSLDVRIALSEAVASAHDVPSEIVRSLASDVSEVALPVLEHSPRLEDGLLLEAVKHRGTRELVAIASRHLISTNLSHAIVKRGSAAATLKLLTNPDAEIAYDTLTIAIETCGMIAGIPSAALDRCELPETMKRRIAEMSDEAILAFAKRFFNIPSRVTGGVAEKIFGAQSA